MVANSSTVPLLLLALLVCPSVQRCSPDCTNADSRTFVRDPTDCTKYYVCLDINGEMVPSVESLSCPDGHYFNDDHTLPRCDPISSSTGDYCTRLCDPCMIGCNSDNLGSLQPHPLDCSKYFICLADGHFEENHCPSSMAYFDYMTGFCQEDSTLCFHGCDPCSVHCTKDGQRLMDPYDCHQFHLCSPPTVAKFLCPHGGVFNYQSGDCDITAPCIVLC
ncbi:peritrophin-1-like [Panulirus ornatus]|uniref:peritrophin-1-like n=1 Tax=Panulirus ornatus TaxID=150431 RepID=UPI003A896FE6